MENQDEINTSTPKTKVSVLSTALNYGLYTGAVLVLLSLIYYVLNVHMVQWLSYMNYIVLIAAIIFATLKYRDKVNGGYINYGQGVAIGAIIGVTVGIILAIYLWVYFTYINVDGIREIMELTEQKFLESGLSDEMVDQQLAISSKFVKMPILNLFSLLGMAFWGTIISLITSIFLKKNDDSFNATFNQ
jgi:disulfide bond formation protein DsbB